jgi:hypothetical protein
LEGLGIENDVIFYGHLEYFTATWYNLQPFGIVCGSFGVFFPFWYVWTKKNLATLLSLTGVFEYFFLFTKSDKIHLLRSGEIDSAVFGSLNGKNPVAQLHLGRHLILNRPDKFYRNANPIPVFFYFRTQ